MSACPFPYAGEPEREDVGRVGEEVALAELVQCADERRRQPSFVERVKRLAGREPRRLAEPGDASGTPLVGFELQDAE